MQAKFAPKLPTKQRERKSNTESATTLQPAAYSTTLCAIANSLAMRLSVHARICSAGSSSPTSASLSSSPSSAMKSEHKSRYERQKPPDRVAFVAASKEGFTRMSGSAANASATRGADEHEEQRRQRLAKMADRMEVEGDEAGGPERKKGGVDDRMQDDKDDDDEEEKDTVNRYQPVTVPFRKQRQPTPSTSTSSPYPPHSPASIIMRPSSSSDSHNLLFFQLPSHLPLQPTSAPIPPTTTIPPLTTSSTASSTTLPSKPPTLAHSTTSTTSSYLLHKQLLQKKKLLTFDPQFTNSLQYVTAGRMGRLLMYRSGRVRMEVGGVRLDVGRGVDCLYHQQVVSVHAEVGTAGASEGVEDAQDAEAVGGRGGAQAGSGSDGRREWVELGDVRERLVCTMDVEDLLRKREGRLVTSGNRAAERSDEKTVGDIKMKEEKL